MSNVIRVALPGYNALTDTNPDHFALYSDEDWVLIKEFSRGTVEIDANEEKTIDHNLGYYPHCYSYAETSTNGRFKIIVGYNIYSDWSMSVSSTQLKIRQRAGTDNREVRYFIFYDDITE